MWCLVVSIPDLCSLSYFYFQNLKIAVPVINMCYYFLQGVLLVFDYTRKRTLNNITDWISLLKTVRNIPDVLNYNKSSKNSNFDFSAYSLFTVCAG